MKTFITFLIVLSSMSIGTISAQVDIQPNSIGINVCPSISEFAINNAGQAEVTTYIVSNDNLQNSTALYAKAFDVTGFGETSTAIIGDANFGIAGSFSLGVTGTSVRTTASNDGRSFGVRGNAGNATPGANYGVFGDLQGTNNGAALVGYDRILYPSWSQVLPSATSYGAYIMGKGYFENNLGLGETDPQEKLHVNGGNIYVEGSANGVILDSGSGCFLITVDASGNLTTTSVTCP